MITPTKTQEEMEYSPETFAKLLAFYNSMSVARRRLRYIALSHVQSESGTAHTLNAVADMIEKHMIKVAPVAPTWPRGFACGYAPRIVMDICLI